MRRLAQAAAAGGMACLGLSAYVLACPPADWLLGGLFLHFYAFRALASGQTATGLALHDQSLALIRTPELALGLWLALAGSALIGLTLHLAPLPGSWWLPGTDEEKPSGARLRPLPILAGAGMLAGTAAAAGPLHGLATHSQFILFTAGIALIVGGIGGMLPRPRLDAADRREVLIVLGIGALALLLRTWNLESAVHRMVDELHSIRAINALDARADTPLVGRFDNISVAFSYLFPYLQTLSVKALGHNLAALRLVSAGFGTLTVLALYLLARTLFDRPTARLAALALAVFPPHIQFSRIGINNSADPLCGVLALAFLARGMRAGRRLDWALGGAALGLTQYFYEGGRLFYPLLAGLWLIGLGLAGRWKPDRHGLGAAALAAGLVAAPAWIALLNAPGPLHPRLDKTGLGGDYFADLLRSGDPAGWAAQGWHTLYAPLAYLYLPDISWFYGDRHPLLLAYVVPFFLLGLAVVIGRARTPGALLIGLWLAGHTLGAGLLRDSTRAPRFVVVFPALALLVGLGLAGLENWLRGQTGRRWPAALTILIAAGLAAGQVAYYFGPFLDHYNRLIRPSYDEEDAVYRALDFPPGTQVLIVTGAPVYPPNIAWMLDFWDADIQVQVMTPEQVTGAYLAGLPRDRDLAFFIPPGAGSVLARLRAQFALGPPGHTPYAVPADRALILYYVAAARRTE